MKRDLAFQIKEHLHTVTEVVDAENRMVKYVEGEDDESVATRYGQTVGAVAGVRRQFIGNLISKKNGHFKEDFLQEFRDKLVSIEQMLEIVAAVSNKSATDIEKLTKQIDAVKDAADNNAQTIRLVKTVQENLIKRVDHISR